MNHCIIFNVDKGVLLRRPAGAYRIATYLREHNWDVEVVEFTTFWDIEQLKQLLLQRVNKNTKFIGFSYLFVSEPIALIDKLGIWLKKIYPHIKILLGSPNKYRFHHDYVDYNINGFGEIATLQLLNYLFANGTAPKFSMSMISGKRIDANVHYPAYPMNSLMIKYQERDFIESHEWLGIEFSRGCMFSCAFCNYPVLGVKGDYTRDSADFEYQIRDAYDNWGVKHYYVADETFNDRTEKITKFADIVENLNFEPYFTGCIRADLLISRPADREELLRMNFYGHLYGVESFNTPSARAIGKGMDSDRIKNGLIEIKEYFEIKSNHRYRGHLSLIAGLPYESIESLYRSRDWVVKNWQKQSYNMHPLEIPIHELDNPSKIGMNWSKYGYSNALNDSELANLKLRKQINAEELLVWKNEHMNVDMAQHIAAEVETEKYKDTNDFRINNYALIRLGLPENLYDRLAVKEKDNLTDIPMKFIKRYINKKLDL